MNNEELMARNFYFKDCGCGECPKLTMVNWLYDVECSYCGLHLTGFEYKSTLCLAWNRICNIENDYPKGLNNGKQSKT